MQRRLLGLLFLLLAAGLALVALAAAREGGGAWAVAATAAVLALWLGDLARRSLFRR
ncbi:MAG TPA: hypothetical protein VNJ53_00030 [Gaiellaceae bacterium]|nr:hypothetical protein [Gaiellaceae bacterium]